MLFIVIIIIISYIQSRPQARLRIWASHPRVFISSHFRQGILPRWCSHGERRSLAVLLCSPPHCPRHPHS